MNTTNYILSKTVGGFLQLLLRGFSAAPPPATQPPASLEGTERLHSAARPERPAPPRRLHRRRRGPQMRLQPVSRHPLLPLAQPQ